MKKSAHGFTLVELLVVIAILAMVGTYALANYSNFGEEQKLKNAALDIQSLLRQAQASATSNAKCVTEYSTGWQVQFLADALTINLNCLESVTQTKKTVELNRISQYITISGASGTSCPTTTPFTVTFAPLSGKISIDGSPNCSLFTVSLTNSKIPSSSKSIVIEQGGRIYVQ